MGDKTPDADAIEADDLKYVMRPWAHPKGEPVIIAKARGCVVTDVHGKDYLDLTAGYFVNNAGHCHPKIAEAATKQLSEVLQVSGKHGTIPMVRLAKKLVELAPKSVEKVFFSTGGSEANEVALKLARQYKKKPDIAYLENGYHGLTIGSLEVTASEKYRESAGKPMGKENFAIPTAYCYRCKFGPHAECTVQCLDGVEEKLASRQTAAIIAYQHHEKFDGTGYPNGLAGDDIHIYGRIVALADVFDALGSDRVYKKAWPLDQILDYFKEQSGRHFDPALVNIFLNNLDNMLAIRYQYPN